MKKEFKEIHLLIGASLFCGLLLLFRIGYWHIQHIDLVDLSVEGIIQSRGSTFLFLAWNLFLAWVPYFLSRLLPFLHPLRRPFNWISSFALLLWLLFFPNAPYILTDLIHLRPRPLVPLWYDLLMILSFAWAGLMLGIFSLLHVQKWAQMRFGKNYDILLAVTLIPLCSLGVFCGRFLRWNSWEVFTHPQLLLTDINQLASNPDLLFSSLGMVAGFSVLLFLIYLPFKMLQKNET